MKKRLVAFLLVLIMVLGMLPVSAFAADDGVSPQALESNETQTIKYQILYVGDEFNTGYNYGVSVNKTYTCQYSTGHSGFNHSILISEFRNVGVPALKGQLDSGYEFVGWAKEAKKNPTIFDFNTAGTTATQTTYTIYLVAKKTNPTPTYMYYLYYKYNDGTDSTWLTDVTDRPTAATTFTFYVNGAKLTRRGYEHIGWADEANATTARYTGGEPIVLNKDNPTKTIYAIWLPIFELHYNANGGTGAPDSQTYTSYSATSTQATFTSRNQIPTKDGYTFKGWADSAAATTAQYQPGGTIAVNHADSPKTVYAVWEKNAAPIEYTVTYYKNDGSANDLFYKTSDWGEPSEKFNIYWGKPTRDGYDFVGWAETRDATEAKYASGGAGGKQSWIKLDGPKVLYAVWQEAGLEPEAPRSPSDCKDQLKTNKIKLVCVDGNHPDKMITFADVSYGSDWSMGDTCKLNFYAKDAALKYPGHAPKNPEERIYVTFKWVNDKTDANGKYLPGEWVMVETTAAVVELVDTGVEAPSKPTTAQLGNIKVTCRTNAEHSSEFPVAKCMGTTVGTVTFDSVKKQWYIDTAPMTTQLASRYDSWKGYAEGTHRLVNPDAELNARFYYDGEKWYTEDTLAIDVCCGAVSEIPGKPDMNQFLGNVLIRCTTDGSTHAEKGRKNIYSNTRDSSMYTEVLDGNGDAIWKDNDGVWTYQIKLIRAKFVEAYSNNQFIKYAHTDTAPNEETILTWKYRNGAWELIKLPGYTEVATIIEVKCAETPVKPEKPTALDGSFAIVCKNNKATHPYKADYIATPSQYTISDVQKDEQGYYVTATVTVAPNLVAYNTATRVEHRLVDEQDATLTITFRYDTEATGDGNRKWKQQQGELPVVEVTCKGIEEPTRDDIFGALNGLVTVTCINRFWKDGNKNMDCGQGQYAAKAGIAGQEYTLEKGENAGTWVVTFPVTNFVKSFKQNPAHNLYTKDKLSWYIRWENNAWTSAPVEPGVDDLVKLTHAPTDWREVAKIATGGKSDCIHVSCVNGETGVCDYGITVPFVYSATDVVSVEPEDGVPGSYIATFKVDRYIDTCAKACNDKNFPDAPRTHKLLTQETVRWRLYATPEADEKIGNNVLNHVWEAEPVEAGKDDVCTIAHNWVVTFNPDNGGDTFTQDVEYEGKATEPAAPEKTGYTFDGWYLDEAEAPFSFDTTITSDITLKAKWEAKKANVHLMIFKSGDLSKPIVDVPYAADKLAGDTIDLTKIDPSSYLDFDFEIDGGWYDDGMFNSYKRYLDGLQDKPAGLEKLLITGNWQNLKLIVTELVPVVYFDSLESLTAYQNDHSKTEGILRTTKARVGSALPTADAPTATRDGYTFTFWSREGQTVDVTDQTVNGWTNLYANWEKKTYKVVAKLYVNGKPAYYQNTNFYTYEVSGLYGEAIDFDTIKAKAVEQAKQIKKSSASYTAVILEDHEPNAVCATYGEHQPGQATHYVKVNVKTEEKVVILQSFAGKTDLTTLHTTTAPYGTNVVEFLNGLGLDLDVAGYTLDTDEDGNTNWYKKDSPKWTFGANDTINGWTNVLLKYTITPHNIYAYLRTGDSIGDVLELNEATLNRLGLTKYNTEGFISIGTFVSNTLLTQDEYYGFDEDEAFLDVLAELQTKLVPETGVSLDKVGSKINWSWLYQPSDVDDRIAGYPTEDTDGYQLSGSLLLYGAKFEAGANDVTGMPTAAYGAYLDYFVSGESFNLPAAPTRPGYDFKGWKIGNAVLTAGAAYTVDEDDMVFTAQWEARTDTPYTVEHYLENLDGSYALDTTEPLKGTTDTTVTAAAKSYDNFTYDSTVPGTVASGNIAGDGSLVLKLFYTRNTYDYTVRHIKQLPDGSYDEANAEVETLSGKFEALAAVTAKDYGSHYPTNDADTKQNIKIEKGLTIDVKYDLDEHTLTFETNGGSAINPVTVRHGNAVARPADPTKDKYTFIGWYADPEFTEEYDFATVLEADKTIYAKFELTSTPIGDIYVRYDVLHIKQLPDGTYDLANAEVEHLSAKKDTTVTAVIKDYRATHHVNVNRTLSKLTGTAIQPYRGVDGKPVYTILSVYYDLDFHTLTFDTMGGSKIAPETVRHGLTVAKPADPVYGGFLFDGWYTDKTFRTLYNFASPLTTDTTVYAKWIPITLPGTTVKKTAPKLNTSDHFAYVQGYPNGTVKPAGNITRAETAAILFRLMDDASRKTYYSTKSGFRDVASGSWYNTYVATLNNAGVITDSSNGYFRPNEAITRAELAAMLAKFSETTGAANYFNDVSAKYWAANAIAICAKLGWITGYPDGTFRPDKNVTRAELMAMINRATGRAPKSADAFLPGMKTWIDNTSDKWYYLDVQEATNSHSYTVKGSETWTALTSDPNWSLYE